MNLAYKDIGKGKTLVFVHSYLWDNKMWKPQYEFLKKNFRCIGIDLPGHGNSKEVNLNSLEELSLKIKELIDNLQIDEYIYIGLSVGGMLAPYLYKYDKEKIKKMIIMDSFSGSEPKSTQDLYFNMLDIIEKNKKIPNELIEKIAPIFFSSEIDKNSKLYLNFKESLKNISEENIGTIVKMGRMIFGRENSMELLKQINIPTYFLTGESDIPRPFSEALSMKKLVKNSKIFKIKKAGHISNLENLKKVNRILKKILK